MKNKSLIAFLAGLASYWYYDKYIHECGCTANKELPAGTTSASTASPTGSTSIIVV